MIPIPRGSVADIPKEFIVGAVEDMVKITPEEAAELAHRVAEFDAALEAIAKAKTRYSAFKRRIAEKYELKSDLFRILNDLSIVMMD